LLGCIGISFAFVFRGGLFRRAVFLIISRAIYIIVGKTGSKSKIMQKRTAKEKMKKIPKGY